MLVHRCSRFLILLEPSIFPNLSMPLHQRQGESMWPQSHLPSNDEQWGRWRQGPQLMALRGTCLSIATGCPGRMKGPHFFMCSRSRTHRVPKHTDEASHQHQFGLRTPLGCFFESLIAQTGLEFLILLPHRTQPQTTGSFPGIY